MILQGVYIKQIFCCCHKKKSIKISLEKTTKISNRRRLISNIFSKGQLMYFLPISFNTISTSSNSIRFTRRRIDMNVFVMMNIFLYLTFTVTSYLSYFTHTFTNLLAKKSTLNVMLMLQLYIRNIDIQQIIFLLQKILK